MAKLLILLAISGIISLCFPPKVDGQNFPPPPGPPPSFGGPPPRQGAQEWDGQRWQGHFDFGNGNQNGYDSGFGNGNPRGTFGGGAFGGNQQPDFPNDGGNQGGRHSSGAGGTSQGGRNFESRNTYNQQGGFRNTPGGYEGRSVQNNPQFIPPNGGSSQRGQQGSSGQQQGTFAGRRDFQGGNGVSQQGGFSYASRGAQGGSGTLFGQQGGVAGRRSRTQDNNEGGTDNQGRRGRRSRNQNGNQNEFGQRGRFFGSATGSQRPQNEVRSQNRFVGLTGRNTTGEISNNGFSGSFNFTE